jgi:hypothetical protein
VNEREFTNQQDIAFSRETPASAPKTLADDSIHELRHWHVERLRLPIKLGHQLAPNSCEGEIGTYFDPPFGATTLLLFAPG